MIDLNEIDVRDYLPHRYPFLLVDRVVAFDSGVSIKVVKNVTHNEPFFNGHFPQKPVMPGVLMIEALAQASGLLIFLTKSKQVSTQEDLYYLAGVENARFKRIVTPGDVLELSVQIVKQRNKLWKFTGRAEVNGELACSADFMNMQG
jgi:3-hydroxyacyl-[acyl-carrier-protein] dehydratase